MSRIRPTARKNRLKGLSKPPEKDEEDKYFVISFRHLDRNQKQTFLSWQGDSILADALETLTGYCADTLQNQCKSEKFKIYGNFPDKKYTEFAHPRHVPQDAQWASMHINGKQCLAGHVVRNVFYIVFLDKDHRFWISEKQHT